jgi:transposase-like protein
MKELSIHIKEAIGTVYPDAQIQRCIMYTTNILEKLNRQSKKVTKIKIVFLRDSSLEKSQWKCNKKWIQRNWNWDQALTNLPSYMGRSSSPVPVKE